MKKPFHFYIIDTETMKYLKILCSSLLMQPKVWLIYLYVSLFSPTFIEAQKLRPQVLGMWVVKDGEREQTFALITQPCFNEFSTIEKKAFLIGHAL